MVTLPDNLRVEMIHELVRQFDAMRWEELTNPERTAAYSRLVKDARVGRRMRSFMAEGDIRVWIKDGPAKEYRRALEGVGPLAAYTARAFPGPNAIVKSALGETWSALLRSVEEKPMRCAARDENGLSMTVIWGSMGALKDLIWHAAVTRVSAPDESITIVIAKPTNVPLSGNDWELSRKLADLIGVRCEQVTYSVGFKPSIDTQAETEFSVSFEK